MGRSHFMLRREPGITARPKRGLCLAKTRSTFELNKMQRRLCNMLHGPAGAIMGQTRFSVGTVTPSAATEGFDLVGSDPFFPSSNFYFLISKNR